MADGQVLIDSKLDSSGVNRGAGEIQKDLEKMAKAASKSAQKIESELKSINVDGVADGMSESFDSEGSKIKEILSDVSADSRTKAARISAEFRNAGMDSSAAMRKAWAIVKSESASGSRAVVSDIDDIGDKAQSVGGSISSGIGGAFKSLLGAAAAYVGVQEVVEFGKTAVETAADIRAENAQFEQTFRDLADTAADSLSSIAKNTGITASRMRKSYTSVYAFSKSVGVGEADALDIANRAMVAAADSAAYYDRSLEDTTETLQSFLKGNYENDAALGFAATETTRNAKANELYAKSFDKLTEAQKVDVLLAMVEAANEASGAMGQAAREADSWTNVTGELSEAWRQFLGYVGEPVLDATLPVLQELTGMLQELPGLIENFEWSDILGDTNVEPLITGLGDAATAAGNLASTIGDSLKPVYEDVLVPLGKWTIEEGLPNSLNAITAALEANASAVEWLAPLAPHIIDQYLTPLAEAADPAIGTSLEAIANGYNAIKTAIDGFGIDSVGLFERFVEATNQLWGLDSPNLFADGIAETGEAAGAASSEIEGIGSAAESASQTASTAFGTLYQISAAAFTNTRDDAVGKIGEIQTAIDGLEGKDVYINIIANNGGSGGFSRQSPSGGLMFPAPSVTSYTPSTYSITPQIPMLATGAVIPPNAPFMAILGDQRGGRNLEAPEDLIRQIVREEAAGAVEVVSTVVFEGSTAQLVRQLLPVIKTEARRRGGNLAEEALTL